MLAGPQKEIVSHRADARSHLYTDVEYVCLPWRQTWTTTLSLHDWQLLKQLLCFFFMHKKDSLTMFTVDISRAVIFQVWRVNHWSTSAGCFLVFLIPWHPLKHANISGCWVWDLLFNYFLVQSFSLQSLCILHTAKNRVLLLNYKGSFLKFVYFIVVS